MKNTTALNISNEQIAKMTGKFRAELRKHRHELPSDIVQGLIGDKTVGTKLVSVLTDEVTSRTKKWHEKDGVIYFSVISDDTTDPEWIKRLEDKGHVVGDYAKQLLKSSDFKPTKGVKYKVAVLKGELFSDENRTTENIRTEADKRKLVKLNAEVACLIREKFTNEEIKEMGLWWIVNMHEPIKDSDGDPDLLATGGRDSESWLSAGDGKPDDRWLRASGFAFAVSQV